MSKVVNLSVAKRIKGLKQCIKDYEKLVTVKKTYLLQLQLFINYSSIEGECRKVKSQIDDLTSQLMFMKNQLVNLSKERNE